MLGLSGEDLGAIWVHLGAILGHPGAILGLPWENLEATWVHLGLRKSCEVENVDSTVVLQAFLKVHGSRHLTCGWSHFENVDISFVL